MDKTKINVDLEVEIEKLGLELINFKRSKEKVIKTCEQMIEYYKRLINGHNEEIALKEKDINLKVINLSQDLEFHETKTLKTGEVLSSIEIVNKPEKFEIKSKW